MHLSYSPKKTCKKLINILILTIKYNIFNTIIIIYSTFFVRLNMKKLIPILVMFLLSFMVKGQVGGMH